MQTEFEFTLPVGYVDREGNVHKRGTMRLATAMDEITPLNDMRVQSNEAYLVIVLLARVITSLGELQHINTSVVENLFAADLAYLQEFYRQINETGRTTRSVLCPHCNNTLEIDLANLGGVS
ncbi:MAG: phage tail assembly protein [Anaerolineae bacterium]|nr:phage tail assembly protein [Anaerolineae bacterium]